MLGVRTGCRSIDEALSKRTSKQKDPVVAPDRLLRGLLVPIGIFEFRSRPEAVERTYRDASRTTSASHASAVGVPRPGLISKRSGASEPICQPEPKAARNSSSVTRRGPQSPGWSSLKHMR